MGGWNGIMTARVPGMAFDQSFTCEQTATPRAVRNDRLLRILGAAGIKTAMLSQERADSQLVGAKQ
jgi:hypothetical protein